MTTIGLIRHGVTEWNRMNKAQGLADIPLNDLGRKQAIALANRLFLEEKWDVIISSHLLRAVETSQIIVTKLELPIILYDERIREINCGEIEGSTEEERVKRWGKNWREMNLGMEKFEDVSRRGIEFLEDVRMKYKDKRVLVVSHGALIGLTLQRLLPEKFSKTNIENTSLTILEHAGNKWTCRLYNCIKHMDS
ncbi:MAG: histidine phosphatase family protein [Bacillaceae bacterium]